MKKIISLMLVLSILFLLSCRSAQKDTGVSEDTQSTSEPVQTEPAEASEETEPTEETETDSPAEAQDVTSINVSLVGDCLLSSYLGTHEPGSYNAYAESHDPSYFFEGVQSVFASDDITIANCETVFTDQTLDPTPKEEDPAYWYYGPSANAEAFSAGSVEVASLANNHVNDYGEEGYNDTVTALEKYGVLVGRDAEPVYVDAGGLTVGILCCNVWGYYQTDRACDILAEMSEVSDVQIVFPHGGVMGTYIPDEWRVYCFRQMIDAGAEVVAGAHPHKLQPVERYNDGVICYSLGDFCFGDAPYHENAAVIMTVEFRFIDGVYDGLSYNIVPCYLYDADRNDYQPVIIDGTADMNYNRIKGFMAGNRETPF